jgi:hypothetical protein
MPPPGWRPDPGKTKTIKQRSAFICAPTEDMLASWKKEAERHGMPLSGFLVRITASFGVAVIAIGVVFAARYFGLYLW